MRVLACLALTALAAGCATPAERAVQLEHEMEQMIQQYGPACEKLGYKNGSDPWRDCILRLDEKDSARIHRAYPPYGVRYRGLPF